MNAASEKRKQQDKVVVIGFLTIAYLICVVGFVVEYDLIAKGFSLFGEFGMFVILFIFLNAGMLGVCYYIGKKYDTIP